jgi:hypothetical protein
MGCPGSVAAHQHLRRIRTALIRVGTPRRRQRRQRMVQDGDVVGGGVRPGAAAAQQSGQGFTPGDLGAVEEGQQRMVTEGLLPGRRRQLFVVGVINDQSGVDVDV